jgi:hypothetical protein
MMMVERFFLIPLAADDAESFAAPKDKQLLSPQYFYITETGSARPKQVGNYS